MNFQPGIGCGVYHVGQARRAITTFALYLAHLAKLAGIPDGVINVVTGFGGTTGAATSSHMDTDCVSFTGSTEVGRVVMQAAATSNLKAVSLELGGKAPLIVFDDVDIDSTVNIALMGGFANEGRFNYVCSSRILVQEGIYDEFVTKFALYAKGMIVDGVLKCLDGILGRPMSSVSCSNGVQQTQDAIASASYQ